MPSRRLDNTYTHTLAHDLISKLHTDNLTEEGCASSYTFTPTCTHKITCTYFHCRMPNISIHIRIQALARQHEKAEPSIHLIRCFPASMPSHLPSLQQGHTPLLPCARTQTLT